MRTIPLMTASQEFSKLIKAVEQGEGFVITRRGRPIAKLIPHSADKAADPDWAAAYERMITHLEEGAPRLAASRSSAAISMTVETRFSLDTNILIYAVDRDSERHRQSRDLMGQAAKRDCMLTLQTLAEFFHATTRKGVLDPLSAAAFVRDWLGVFVVASADDD